MTKLFHPVSISLLLYSLCGVLLAAPQLPASDLNDTQAIVMRFDANRDSIHRLPDAETLRQTLDKHPELINAEAMNMHSLDLDALAQQRTIAIELLDGEVIHVLAERTEHLLGNRLSVSGPIEGIDPEWQASASLLISANSVTADIQMPEGPYRIRTVNRTAWMLDPAAIGALDETGNLDGDQTGKAITTFVPQTEVESRGGIQTLNVAMVLSQTHGLSQSAVNSALMAITRANTEFANSDANVRLNPVLLTRVKPSLDNGLNSGINQTVREFSKSGSSWLDLNYVGLEAAPGAQSVHVHQYALFVGSDNDNLCGVSAAPPGGTSRHMIVRVSGCSDPYTLAHEMGHNLSCIHWDGSSRTFFLFNDPDLPRLWKSVMTSGFNPSGPPQQFKSHFTAGADSNSSPFCGGICATTPYAAHDCVGKMNAVAPSMSNRFDTLQLPVDTTPPDVYEDDDAASRASNYLGSPQRHNFHDNSDRDWLRYYSPAATVVIATSALEPRADTCLRLYRSNSSATGTSGPALASNCDGGPGQASQLVYHQTDEGLFYVEVYQQNGAVSGAQTQYTVTVTATQTSGTPDAYEVDNTAPQASPYTAVPQTHNFHVSGDIDWVTYYALPGTRVIETTLLGAGADTCISLYRSNSTATGTSGGVLASNCDGGPGQASRLAYNQPDEYVYYVRIYNQNGQSGNHTGYRISIQ